MSIKFSKESRIFRDFRCIPYADYHYLVRFYEQYFADIDHLSFDESMIITYYYAVALYETEAYYSFLTVADDMIEKSIINSIQYIDGQDVYMNLLYKKVVAQLQLKKQRKALHLAKQLVRIAPQDEQYTHLLYHCYRDCRPAFVRKTLLISAAIVLTDAIFMVVLTSLYTQWSSAVYLLHYLLMLSTLGGLMASAVHQLKYVMLPTRQIKEVAQSDKRSKKVY